MKLPITPPVWKSQASAKAISAKADVVFRTLKADHKIVTYESALWAVLNEDLKWNEVEYPHTPEGDAEYNSIYNAFWQMPEAGLGYQVYTDARRAKLDLRPCAKPGERSWY